MRAMRNVAPLLLVLAAACSTSESAPTPDAGTDDDAGRTFGGARPVTVRVPAGYDPSKPAPLVMMLHGYASAPVLTELYFKMSSIADKDGFFYVAPFGTFDRSGARFWNATDACCDSDATGIDDVGYLTALVREVQGAYAIDPKRIYVMGHSNGAFMAHRLACDHAETFAAIASFAGAVWADPSKCAPRAPVGVLEIHGTADAEVLYAGTIASADGGDAGAVSDGGGSTGAPYPGAKQTVATWAAKNGCTGALTDTGTRLHVDSDAMANETTVSRYAPCAQNGAAELWSVNAAGHVIDFTPESLDAIWQFLSAHAKP
jgi:polyhydroxybutyrate depolymerase